MSVIEECAEIKEIRGIYFPKEMDEHRLIITGPPGSGKSTILTQIRGWPEEGYIDISSQGWWKHSSLSFRPRELHFGLPLVNMDKTLPIYEINEFEENLEIDFGRIQLPPRKSGLFAINWSRRICFEFLVPPAEILFEYRIKRASKGTHHVDAGITLARVKREVNIYKQVALFFHRSGLRVHLRDGFGCKPKYFTELVILKNPTLFKTILGGHNKVEKQSYQW